MTKAVAETVTVTTTVSVEPKSKINPEVQAVADRFVAAATVDPTSGATPAPANFYATECGHYKDFPITEDSAVHHARFNKQFVAGTALGFGQLGNAAMAAKGSDLASVSCEVPTVEGGRLEMYMPRTSTGRNPKTGETTTSHGRLSADWVSGVGDRSGQMSHVLNHLKELGAKTLGNN